jgi:hypothetical protein
MPSAQNTSQGVCIVFFLCGTCTACLKALVMYLAVKRPFPRPEECCNSRQQLVVWTGFRHVPAKPVLDVLLFFVIRIIGRGMAENQYSFHQPATPRNCALFEPEIAFERQSTCEITKFSVHVRGIVLLVTPPPSCPSLSRPCLPSPRVSHLVDSPHSCHS